MNTRPFALQDGKVVAPVTLPDASGPAVTTSTTSMHILAIATG